MTQPLPGTLAHAREQRWRLGAARSANVTPNVGQSSRENGIGSRNHVILLALCEFCALPFSVRAYAAESGSPVYAVAESELWLSVH